MTTIHSIVEPRKHVKVIGIGEDDVALDIGRPGRPAVSLAAIRVPVADLRAALDEVAPAGSYTRSESPDLMDGGVTAALIEKEAEPTDVWRRRAEQAEKERDEARARTCLDPDAHWRLDEAQETIQRLTRERDEARALATEHRPLTPDAITDEMVERAGRTYVRALGDRGYAVSMEAAHTREAFGKALTAALTEPPARPEWADVEDVLNAGWPEGINGAENSYVARNLHTRGVRVVGEEQS